MKSENLLPRRLEALEAFLKTGDVKLLREFFETPPNDYKNPDGHDEWRICAGRILGIPEERVTEKMCSAIKHALYTLAYSTDDLSNTSHTPPLKLL